MYEIFYTLEGFFWPLSLCDSCSVSDERRCDGAMDV